MKILLATGIYEPEFGGPATVARQLADDFSALGHNVSILTYSTYSKYDLDANRPFNTIRVKRQVGFFGKIASYIQYLYESMILVKDSDVIYTLDSLASGIPVYISTKLLRKKYLLRIGGDYIWEKYIQSGEGIISIKNFNKNKLYKKFPVLYYLIKKVLKGASFVIFNSKIQSEIFMESYEIDRKKIEVIYNQVKDNKSLKWKDCGSNEIIFAGRIISVKNISNLILAFKKANIKNLSLTIIGDGPNISMLKNLVAENNITERVNFISGMNKEELANKIISCKYLILPSWSDVSPNQFYEARLMGAPLVITKENFLKEYNDIPFMVDPESVDDIAEKMLMLENSTHYSKLCEYYSSPITINTDEFLSEHIRVLNIK